MNLKINVLIIMLISAPIAAVFIKIIISATARRSAIELNVLRRKLFLLNSFLNTIIASLIIMNTANAAKSYALMVTHSKHAFVSSRPLDNSHYDQIKLKDKVRHKLVAQTDARINSAQFIANNESQIQQRIHNNSYVADIFASIIAQNSSDRHNVSLDIPRVVYHPHHQLETEFCDMIFIDEKDRLNAYKEFIAPQKLSATSLKYWKRQRNRRAITKYKTIETAVYVDKELLNRFNGAVDDLTRLVLAIMNEVQLIFSFKTMKTRIKIVIAKLVFLKDGDNAPHNADGDIDGYLDNFCAWQSKRWRMTHNVTEKWDHAIMLTGLDLYKQIGDKKNKKVLGLAWVNGMCKPSYSCTLNEGKSFEAAFVIAHEMGHSLGILHDGTGNNCDTDKYIMSDKTGPGKVNWSPCSNVYLENFLSKANAKCLDDEAEPQSNELDFEKSSRLPGEQYPPNKQCQLALGSLYKAYSSYKEPFNNICRELWCLSGSWATPAHPALEGSACGDRRKCIQGVCTNSSPTLSRRSITNYRNRILPNASKSVATRLSPSKNSGIGFTRSFMESVKGFLRSATNGAQEFLDIFNG